MDRGWLWSSAADARAAGLALRDVVSLTEQAECPVPADRPSVERFLAERAVGRMPQLLPLAHQRMAASPFAFFRGSAGLMARDLAATRSTGLIGQLCGDAHAANLGLYGAADGRVVMDINDFDETVQGPWEWDLKRLATSLVLAGRTGAQVGDRATSKAARHAAREYRKMVRRLAEQPFLESFATLGGESTISIVDADNLFDDFRRAASAAARNTSERATVKIAHRHEDGEWHFVESPPVLTEVDDATARAVIAGLESYRQTLRQPWDHAIVRFRPRAVAHRVVGTGSVGLRSYLVLLQGNGDESLILQLKQSAPSALAPFLPPTTVAHEAQRVVHGARFVQAETDPLMGWTTIDDRPYVVRQFRNRKGSIDATLLTDDHIDDYGRLAGALLARAHSRSIDPRVLAAYLEDGREMDAAIAAFATTYADRVEADHAALRELIAAGRIEVAPEER